ncbi:MAG: (Fe-S)-binding protein [Deltaproteobacteria bacterium]|nr:(Fe-S)-binding protein [Deltaproteobacteria bacterium]
MKTLPQVLDEARKCVKCGNCMAQCPVYLETLEEPFVARGKLGLIEAVGEGDSEFSKRFSKILSLCLLCGTCAENCPNGIQADEIIRQARSLFVEERGLSLSQKTIFRYLLDSEQLMPLLLKGGVSLQHLFLEKIPEESGLRLRFPVPFIDQRRLIPPLAQDFFLDLHSGWVRAEKEVKRVGLFVGCVSNYLFPRISRAALDIFLHHGVSIYIPGNQRCCGLPAFGSGDEQTPLSLAQKNIEAFADEDLEKIVAPCASCASMLKLNYPLLFDESDPMRPQALTFSSKVTDASQFLGQFLGQMTISGGQGRKAKRVTYHDPCHLRRKLGIFKEPRSFLKALPGLEYVEMREANRCCGQGGSFNIANYDLSLKILERKIQAIEHSDADVVATACSGCLLQIMDGLHQQGLKKEVRHLVEIVDQATLL